MMTSYITRMNISTLLPYETPVPADAKRRKTAAVLRVIGYGVIIGAILVSLIQYQYIAWRNSNKAAQWNTNHGHLDDAELRELGLSEPKGRSGAIQRWAIGIRAFWAGDNIYISHDHPGDQHIRMHPNTPGILVLMTPLAFLPPDASALAWNLCKLVAIVLSLLMAVRVANHGDIRMVDWAVFLAVLWSLRFIMGDIRHANTNTFVLFAIVLHLWLFRTGRDLWAGCSLGLAICLKMTPALFMLYWIYQRNWRLLAGMLIGLAVIGVVLPAAAMGPTRYVESTQCWLNNLIKPGLVKGSWYPIHVNQSFPAVMSRLFFGEPNPNGDIFWNPDDYIYGRHGKGGWIALVSLGEPVVKGIVRAGQVIVLALMAWAIGLRKLPRDDARRNLHYAMVVLAMMMLNQRTWDHHAAVLLPAGMAVWFAITQGRLSAKARVASIVLVAAAGLGILAAPIAGLAQDIFGPKHSPLDWKDMCEAYGPVFFHFALLFVACVIMCLSLKNKPTPYAIQAGGATERPISCTAEPASLAGTR